MPETVQQPRYTQYLAFSTNTVLSVALMTGRNMRAQNLTLLKAGECELCSLKKLPSPVVLKTF